MFLNKTPIEQRRNRSFPLFGTLFSVIAAGVFAAPVAEAKRIYVNIAAANANGDGESWTTSFKYLQDALAKAKGGDEVWLAKGTYFPDDRKDGRGLGDREMSFVLQGISLHGGFAGTEGSLGQRNIAANPTFLDGAIWRDSNYNDGAGDEVYWTLNVLTVEKDSTITGLTVQHGNASGYLDANPLHSGGGALVKTGATLTMDQARFYRNRAVNRGGAIAGNVVAKRSVFEENSLYGIYSALAPSEFHGGAIAGDAILDDCRFINNMIDAELTFHTDLEASGGAITGKVNARNCLFEGNYIDFHDFPFTKSNCAGGAISGDAALARCQFISNRLEMSIGASVQRGATVDGGGGAVEGRFTVIGCFFENNVISGTLEGNPLQTKDGPVIDDLLTFGGGALLSRSDTSTIDNSVFNRNSVSASRSGGWRISSYHGGGVILQQNGVLAVTSSTFYGNSMPGGQTIGSIILVENSGDLNLLNNIFAENRGSSFGAILMDSSASILRITTKIYSTLSTTSRNFMDIGSLGFFGGTGDIIQLGNTDVTLITGDPGFVNPTNPRGPDNTWGTADDGLRLRADSPANDVSESFYFWLTEFAGYPLTDLLSNYLALDTLDLDRDGNVAETAPVDAAGFNRIQDKFVDLGAYEFGNLKPVSEIDVQYPKSTSLVDGSASVKFPDTTRGASSEITFLVSNSGRKKLTLSGVSFSGPHAGAFSVVKSLPAFINSDQNAELKIRFTPTFAGQHTVTMRIGSDDVDENPFDIILSGKGGDGEITVTQAGTTLTDGISKIDFGRTPVNVGKIRTFTIKNTGNIDLSISRISFGGKFRSAFSVVSLSSDLIQPGRSALLKVRFETAKPGQKTAKMNLFSNDRDENPFTVALAAQGFLAADIAVTQPAKRQVKDNGSRNFGTVHLGSTYTKTFTITNQGDIPLKRLRLSISGSQKFSVSQLEVKKLAVGKSTKFQLKFRPTNTQKQKAVVTIRSNDPDESPFTIRVSGQGKQPAGAKFAALLPKAMSAMIANPVIAETTVGNEKYLSLTIQKTATAKPLIEVSPNLVDWFSGPDHTTIVIDNETTLKVRDNTPASAAKRHIRARFTR